MNKNIYRGLRIAGGVLCLVAAVSGFVLTESTTPPAVQILTLVGVALFGALLFLWDTPSPAWVMWLLIFGSLAGLYSSEVYEVIEGQRHWLRLIPLPALLLIGIFWRTRDDKAA